MRGRSATYRSFRALAVAIEMGIELPSTRALPFQLDHRAIERRRQCLAVQSLEPLILANLSPVKVVEQSIYAAVVATDNTCKLGTKLNGKPNATYPDVPDPSA
jgi:hypothetical protein